MQSSHSRPLIVGIGGTTRTGSTSELALRTTLQYAETLGCDTHIFAGLDLPFEMFDPTKNSRNVVAKNMIDALRLADGIVIASPAYHGSISGLIKNAIDYTEDMRNDDRPYFMNRAVGLIVCADGAQAMGATLAGMRAMVHALRGWPTPYAATINSTIKPFGVNGQSPTPETLSACQLVAKELVQMAIMLKDGAMSTQSA